MLAAVQLQSGRALLQMQDERFQGNGGQGLWAGASGGGAPGGKGRREVGILSPNQGWGRRSRGRQGYPRGCGQSRGVSKAALGTAMVMWVWRELGGAREEKRADGVNASAGGTLQASQVPNSAGPRGRTGAGLAAACAAPPPPGICEDRSGDRPYLVLRGSFSTPPPATTLPTHTALRAALQPRRPDTPRRSAGLVEVTLCSATCSQGPVMVLTESLPLRRGPEPAAPLGNVWLWSGRLRKRPRDQGVQSCC